MRPGKRQIATDQYHGLTIIGFRQVLQTQGEIVLHATAGDSPERYDESQYRQQDENGNQTGCWQKPQARAVVQGSFHGSRQQGKQCLIQPAIQSPP